ncbi:MAG: nucleoside monophosphate kinase [Candidatus Aegiribacteria sp.]|nr:nucleoside monophosphate kinase [Candidatus Aegiribacteria sp.]
MRIVFFGPPGSGKGTQADRMSKRYKLHHLSTGLMLREEIHNKSELGKRIRKIVESGHLVDDETVNEEVFSKVCKYDRFLLDGYPRNLFQAESLDEYLEEEKKPLSGAVFITIPDEEVIERLSGRLTCSRCGFTGKQPLYHPGDECIRCGTALIERNDDRTEVIEQRLVQYHSLTKHLEKYYHDRLLIIDGMGTVDQVALRLEEALSIWE